MSMGFSMIRNLDASPTPAVSVIVGTYGDDAWYARAQELVEGIEWPGLNFTEVITCHADTLAEARNEGGDRARGTWLVFLDADDFLSPGYVAEVSRVDWDVDIYCPSVRGFRILHGPELELQWLDPEPHLPKVTPLIRQNYLPIGSFVKREMFDLASGFDEYPVLEDWAFWLECERQGATFGQLPEAVYCINDDHLRSKYPESDRIAREIRAEYR